MVECGWCQRLRCSPVTATTKKEPFMEFFRAHYRRTGLATIAVLWTLVATCYVYLIDRPDRFMPWAPPTFFFAAAMAMFLFAIRPASEMLFTLAGGFSVVALFSRAASSIGSQFVENNPNAWPIAVSSAIVNMMLFFLFWWFWQQEVKPFHIYYQRLKDL